MAIGFYCMDCSDGIDNGAGIHCKITGETKGYFDQCHLEEGELEK